MTAQHEPAWPRFIDYAQFDVFTAEFLEEFIPRFQRAADDAVTADLGGILRRDGNRNRFFMDVQTDIMHFLVHGCLVPFIDDESGASHASHIADRSPLGDNPRYYT